MITLSMTLEFLAPYSASASARCVKLSHNNIVVYIVSSVNNMNDRLHLGEQTLITTFPSIHPSDDDDATVQMEYQRMEKGSRRTGS